MSESLTKALVAIDWQGLLLPTLSILEKALRPLAVFAFLVAALRVMGRRELAQLSILDVALLLLLSNTLQNAIIGNDVSLTGAIVGAGTLMAVNWAASRFLRRHRGLEERIEGGPELLVNKGMPDAAALGRELVSVDQLLAAARRDGIEKLADIERAELMPNGEFLFVRRGATREDKHHAAVMRKLARLESEVGELRKSLARGNDAARR